MMTDTEDDDIGGMPAEEGEAKKPKSAKPWLALIAAQERAGFSDWQDKCTNIEKRYAELSRLASISRDREFQIFWANIEVLKPSMYARPPVPVVTPRFKDRKPIVRAAAELLERSTVVGFEMEDIDAVMKQCRDDLALLNRGALWCRYEARSRDNNFTERVCVDHKNRFDFIHDPAREWKEVDWVGGGAWLTRKEMRKRFGKTSGNAYRDAAYERRKDENDHTDGKLKARVWEIWCKSENKVVWVSPGVDVVLDEGEPHLKLEGFFPCPRPAYGTLQRNSLIPVPDFLFYKDQVEEINEVTARIASLTEAVRVRGFYPAGAGEIGDVIEAAIKSTDNRQVMVPVSNWAAFGNGSAKDTIVWLPLDMIVTTITSLIALRRQLIEDVYQISGLSDVMRGSTDPNETLGAQTLKTQYGSVRIRDRQAELVRLARDAVRIAAEIMAENFQQKTLLEMSQMDFKTDAEVAKEAKAIEAQAREIITNLQQAQADPEVMQLAQQNPEQAQQIFDQHQQQVQQLQAQAAEVRQTVTIDQVMDFLRDQRIRPFVLDIETDSTIQPDEDAEKKRRAEFLTAMGTVMAQLAPMVEKRPATAPFAGEILKFAVAPFRVGRTMETSIDEFVEKLQQLGQQPQGPDPATQAAEAEAKARAEEHQADMAMKQEEHAFRMQEMRQQSADRQAEIQAKRQAEAAKHQQETASKLVEQGLPPDFSLENVNNMNTAQFNAIMAELTAQRQATGEQTEAVIRSTQAMAQSVIAAVTAPKMIIRDANDRPIGVQTVA